MLHLLAWGVFGVGLLGPLTPSEGAPRPLEIGVFAAGPVALLGGAFAAAKHWAATVLAVLGIGTIVAATAWLLRLQHG
jgi:hypothetical protein